MAYITSGLQMATLPVAVLKVAGGVAQSASCYFGMGRDPSIPPVVTLGSSGRFQQALAVPARPLVSDGAACSMLLGLPIQGIEILGAGVVEEQ